MTRTRTALSISAALFGLAFIAITPASADFVIADDLIVDGSACIGFDCVNGEVFGFDTLRLKENNLRIRAVDTSSTASFPTFDWQITFNETTNGGANKFSVEDLDSARTPFTIEGGAPSHSLYVDDGGRIGLGTSTPVVEVHIKDGDTPTLRLEQDGSSGFTPQTWDVAGNETNFFIRDVTNGSRLPFRIRPNAPTSSIDVAGSTGNVGFGTTSPAHPIQVSRSDGTARIEVTETGNVGNAQTLLKLDHNGIPQFVLENDNVGRTWLFANDGSFFMNNPGNAGVEMRLGATGDLEILGGLITTGGGGACTAGDPCDGVFDPDFEVESIEEHSEYMWRNRHLRGVGPTRENGPINITKKTGGLINELEKAHIYIEQLHSELGDTKVALESRSALIDELMARVEALESPGVEP